MSASPTQRELLDTEIERTGYYPQLVRDVVEDLLEGPEIAGHLVHMETTFDRDEIHRHITVLILGRDILHAVHVDDQQFDEDGHEVIAMVSTESVALASLRSVAVSFAYYKPQDYTPGFPVNEVNLAVTWTGSRTLDLQPAACEDPSCDADHGYTGVSASQDITLRISAEADGWDAVESARTFARTLRRAVAAAGR